MPAQLFIRINFERSGARLGPGMLELMKRIEQHGSIRKAAASMNMSYQKAWLLIDRIQQMFGETVVTSESGTHLTELGHQLVQTLGNVQKEAESATAGDVQMLSNLVRKGRRRRLVRKGVSSSVPRPIAWGH